MIARDEVHLASLAETAKERGHRQFFQIIDPARPAHLHGIGRFIRGVLPDEAEHALIKSELLILLHRQGGAGLAFDKKRRGHRGGLAARVGLHGAPVRSEPLRITNHLLLPLRRELHRTWPLIGRQPVEGVIHVEESLHPRLIRLDVEIKLRDRPRAHLRRWQGRWNCRWRGRCDIRRDGNGLRAFGGDRRHRFHRTHARNVLQIHRKTALQLQLSPRHRASAHHRQQHSGCADAMEDGRAEGHSVQGLRHSLESSFDAAAFSAMVSVFGSHFSEVLPLRRAMFARCEMLMLRWLTSMGVAVGLPS